VRHRRGGDVVLGVSGGINTNDTCGNDDGNIVLDASAGVVLEWDASGSILTSAGADATRRGTQDILLPAHDGATNGDDGIVLLTDGGFRWPVNGALDTCGRGASASTVGGDASNRLVGDFGAVNRDHRDLVASNGCDAHATVAIPAFFPTTKSLEFQILALPGGSTRDVGHKWRSTTYHTRSRNIAPNYRIGPWGNHRNPSRCGGQSRLGRTVQQDRRGQRHLCRFCPAAQAVGTNPTAARAMQGGVLSDIVGTNAGGRCGAIGETAAQTASMQVTRMNRLGGCTAALVASHTWRRPKHGQSGRRRPSLDLRRRPSSEGCWWRVARGRQQGRVSHGQ
jgi:hypothetical protein